MTLVTTPFGFSSTAADVIAGVDLTGKRAIVTGAASGIGVETARALAGAGAEVTIAVRRLSVGEEVAAELNAGLPQPRVRAALLDLIDIESVQAFTAAWDGPLHILVNNAGIMAAPEERTARGWESQFVTNHLGHFALAAGLHRQLAAEGARIVALSSSAHMLSPVIFDDLHFDYRSYDPWLAYGQAKSANILFAVGASARWSGDGITANSLNPGAIKTNLQRHVGNRLTTPPELQKTTAQGASTSVLLAASPLLDGVSGRYFNDNNEAPVVPRKQPGYAGVAPYVLDRDNAARLWDASERLLAT